MANAGNNDVVIDIMSSLDDKVLLQLLPTSSNSEERLSCLFDFLYCGKEENTSMLSRWTNAAISTSRLEEGTDADIKVYEEFLQEILSILIWDLPLHYWSRIVLHDSSIKIFFEPDVAVVVKCGSAGRKLTRTLSRMCTSHVQYITIDNPPSAPSSTFRNLERGLTRQQNIAFGKVRKTIPQIDEMKMRMFESWRAPMKLHSLLFQREIGAASIQPIIIENAMRFEIAGKKLHKIVHRSAHQFHGLDTI